MPRGQEAARGAKKRDLLVADRGVRHGVSAAVALKALQLDELAGLGGLLDGVEKRERLDVIGGGHDGLDLAADDLHKVLELHLVRQCRVDSRNLHLQRLVPVGGAVVGELVQAGQRQGALSAADEVSVGVDRA